MIKHIWFDFSGTLLRFTREYKQVHHKLVCETYARVINKSLTPVVTREYHALYKKHKTNSQVFIELGKHADFWAEIMATLDRKRFIDKRINYRALFENIRARSAKISLFTNSLGGEVRELLPHMGLAPADFDAMLTGEMMEKKPSLDGFYKIIKLSKLKPSEILYVGDRIDGEILPAKRVGLKAALVWSREKKTAADFTLRTITGVLKCLG